VELHYQNLGRSTFEKWINYDGNILDTDTNNFTHLGGLVKINLARPFENTAPKEYVEYCTKNSIQPCGNILPIGNFSHPTTELRETFRKNVSIENNRISFEI
jgi:hypothetical protein